MPFTLTPYPKLGVSVKSLREQAKQNDSQHHADVFGLRYGTHLILCNTSTNLICTIIQTLIVCQFTTYFTTLGSYFGSNSRHI